jgi:hypothetical protein
VFLYELLAGVDPFADDDPMNVYKKILDGKVKFPKFFDKCGKSLVKRLLQQDLSKRYGNLIGGCNDIKNHKFFKEMEFFNLINMELKPPYVPKVISSSDISNFSLYPDSGKEVVSISTEEDPFLNW